MNSGLPISRNRPVSSRACHATVSIDSDSGGGSGVMWPGRLPGKLRRYPAAKRGHWTCRATIDREQRGTFFIWGVGAKRGTQVFVNGAESSSTRNKTLSDSRIDDVGELIKRLKLIQGVVDRLARRSFAIKAAASAVTTALKAVVFKQDHGARTPSCPDKPRLPKSWAYVP